MKKIILIMALLILFGCGTDQYAKFDRYQLKVDDLISYEYFHGRDKATYAIGLLEDSIELDTIGFFYKINDKDYILLDKFYEDETSVFDLNNNPNKSTFRFYDNKLFYRQYFTVTIYTLNREKTKKEEIQFATQEEFEAILIKANEDTESNRHRAIRFIQIKDIDENYIYLDSVIDNIDYPYFISACSLTTHKCEEVTN